jgi:hypothetical protein
MGVLPLEMLTPVKLYPAGAAWPSRLSALRPPIQAGGDHTEKGTVSGVSGK